MQYFSKSDLGKVRQSNQDYYLVKNEKIGIFNNLFLVADGVGSNSKSAYASKHSCDFFVEQLYKSGNGSSKIEEISKALRLTNIDLYYKILSNQEYNGMGTTFICGTIFDNKLLVSNVGDSRCYYVRDNKIVQITHDHSVAEELVRENAIQRNSDKYLEFKHQLTRAIGAKRQIDPDFFELELKENDYLLFCSDGLTNMLSDDRIKEIILDDELTLENRVKFLIDDANDNGGKDNITVILVYIEDFDLISSNDINISSNTNLGIDTNIDININKNTDLDKNTNIDKNTNTNIEINSPMITYKKPHNYLDEFFDNGFRTDSTDILNNDVDMFNLRVDVNKFLNKDDIKIYEGLKGRSRKKKYQDKKNDIRNLRKEGDDNNEH